LLSFFKECIHGAWLMISRSPKLYVPLYTRNRFVHGT